MRPRTLFIASLLTSSLSACSNGGEDMKQEPLLPSSPGKAESGADGMLHWTFVVTSAVHSAFGRVKDDVKPNEPLLFDEINSSFEQGIIPNDHIVESAAGEVLEQMQMTNKHELAAETYGLLSRFVELMSLPRESIQPRRLGKYLDDSISVASKMSVFLRWYDDEDNKEPAYYFASAYNLVASTHILGLAAGGYTKETIEGAITDEVETNQHLLGRGEASDPGFLSDWVAAQTPGSASAAMKLDKDPIVYAIRHFLEEQQQALE
jgi:hypothetical protein